MDYFENIRLLGLICSRASAAALGVVFFAPRAASAHWGDATPGGRGEGGEMHRFGSGFNEALGHVGREWRGQLFTSQNINGIREERELFFYP